MATLQDLVELGDDGCVMVRVPHVTFPIEEMEQFYHNVCKQIDKTVPRSNNPAYGGWSILSGNGEVSDGWQPGGGVYIRDKDGSWRCDEDRRTMILGDANLKWDQPTILATHPVCEAFLQLFAEMGLCPKRTRLAEIDELGGNNWHVDSPTAKKGHWRAHIAIVTNPTSTFEWRQDKDEFVTQIPCDGHLYFIRADRFHRVRNVEGQRVHLITDFTRAFRELPLEIEPVFYTK